jgi:hypothetical protein
VAAAADPFSSGKLGMSRHVLCPVCFSAEATVARTIDGREIVDVHVAG